MTVISLQMIVTTALDIFGFYRSLVAKTSKNGMVTFECGSRSET